MRTTTTTIICDRCGANVDARQVTAKVTLTLSVGDQPLLAPADLGDVCPECLDAIAAAYGRFVEAFTDSAKEITVGDATR